MKKSFVKCKWCGVFLPQVHTGSCPRCGKEGRVIYENLTMNMKAYTGIKGQIRKAPNQKPYLEFVSKTEPSTHPNFLGNDVDYRMTVDRQNDRYLQTITNLKTGKIIHSHDEPLSEHNQKKDEHKKS